MNPRHLLQAAVFLCGMALTVAQQNTAAPSPQQNPPVQPAETPLPQDPNEYIRQTIQHELAEQDRDHSRWRYHFHREDEKSSFDRDVIETNEGNLSRTLLWNGQPLTPELRQKDNERLQKLINDPADRAKHAKREKEDGEKAHQMLKAVPEAFTFQYDGEEDGQVRLAFTPNSLYNAPNRELQVFRSLSGKIWIDRASNRLARIDGTLFEDVTFGFGLLGRLNKGGKFDVVQQQVAPGHWEVVSLEVNMSGHAVIFKTINVRQREKLTDFQRVPDSLTMSQAYAIMQNDPHSVATTNGHAESRMPGKD